MGRGRVRIPALLLTLIIAACTAGPGDTVGDDDLGRDGPFMPAAIDDDGFPTDDLTRPTPDPAGHATDCDPAEVCEVEVAWTEISKADLIPDEIVVGGSTAYVTTDEGQVLEVDLVELTVVNTFELESEAVDVVLQGNDLWVLTLAGPVRVDRLTGKAGPTLASPVHQSFAQRYHIAASEDAVWISSNGTGEVVRFDPASGSAVATITDYDNLSAPGSPRLTYAFGSLWVIDRHAGRLLRIDPATDTIAASFDDLGFEAEETDDGLRTIHAQGPLAVTATDDALWVISDAANPAGPGVVGRGAVYRIDPASAAVARVLELIAEPAETSFAVGSDAVWYLDVIDHHLIRAELASGQQYRLRLGLRTGRGVAMGEGIVWVTAEGVFVSDPSGIFGVSESATFDR